MLLALKTALCLLGFIPHDLVRRSQFRQGRRERSGNGPDGQTRPPDPPGWGFVTTWIECRRCNYQRTVGTKECWEADYEREQGRIG